LQTKKQDISKLLEQCLKGKHSAQLEIYKCYYKVMYNTALRILNNNFEAEDVMQESFLTAFSKLGTFKSKSKYGTDFVPFGSWLKRIVINKSLTQLKKNKKLESWQQNKETIENLAIAEEEKQTTDFSKLKAKEILEAINSLKTNYKTVLTLNLIEGYDNEEISEILNITNQNTRTTISRAKNKLKKILLKKLNYEFRNQNKQT